MFCAKIILTNEHRFAQFWRRGFHFTTLVCPVFPTTAAQGEKRKCAAAFQQWEVNQVAGDEGLISPENTTVECNEGNHCYGLWEKSLPGEVRLVKQGTTKRDPWRGGGAHTFVLFLSRLHPL